ETPTGSYSIQYKAVNPWWQPPWGGAVVPPGPQNPLGTRWIQFWGGYGIHGNNNPDSIGGWVSAGCIRMYKEDVEWLYDQVAVGMPVRVTYETVQVQSGPGGRRYLAVYPDGYGKGATGVAGVLRAAGIEPDAVAVSGPGLYPLDAGVLVNGHYLPAILHKGKPYLPAVKLAERLGATVAWHAESSSVTLDGQTVATVVRGDTEYVEAGEAAAVLGVEYQWDASTATAVLTGRPLFLNGHLLNRAGANIGGEAYLPVRAVGEAAGAAVTWDNATRQALINGVPIASVLVGSKAYADSGLLAQALNLRIRWTATGVYLDQ
ncbi:MAG TPA: L,D-transpeptidase family protein, partial [Symbiobacteriaceae bacterium]|nr:L,D-transpeptidase family protein [Symbiobacteriaceae bacterium]